MNTVSSPSAVLQAATTQFNTAAKTIMRAAAKQTDHAAMVQGLTQATESKAQLRAGAVLVRAQQEMMGAILDIHA